MHVHINYLCLVFQQGLCFNGSAFILYLIAAIVDASSVTKELDSHNYNSWAASSVSSFFVYISSMSDEVISKEGSLEVQVEMHAFWILKSCRLI